MCKYLRDWLQDLEAAQFLLEERDVPARGTTLIFGGPKVIGATGGPSRLISLVHVRRMMTDWSS